MLEFFILLYVHSEFSTISHNSYKYYLRILIRVQALVGFYV